MHCPNCGNTDCKVTDSRFIAAGVQRRGHDSTAGVQVRRSDSKIYDSRVISAGIQRRRQCKGCGLRFVTFETHLHDTDLARGKVFSQVEYREARVE